MKIEINRKVLHEEWDEACLTPEQFVLFYKLIDKEEVCLSPTFIFDKGTVYADEGWCCQGSKVVTSSNERGTAAFYTKEGEYMESYCGMEKKLGQLVSVQFTVDEEVLAVFKLMEATK